MKGLSIRSRRWSVVLLASVVVWGAACSTKLPTAGVKAYHRCDYQKAIDVFRKRAAKGDKDFVLYNLAALSAAMRMGDYKTAERSSIDALQVMWSDAGKGKGVASLVSAEAIKIFKGEPFEKSMAAVYAGIMYYNKGEFDNARASFGKAILAIKQKQVGHRDDFGLPYVLQAKTFLKLNEVDNARIALRQARKLYPQYKGLTLERLQKSNVLFVVELGRVAEKIRTGPGASLADWKRRRYREQGVTISVEGRDLGSAWEVGDLTYQAKTKGRTGKDAIQATKGVTREAAAATAVVAATQAKDSKAAGWVAIGAGLFALANQSQADVRQWELLPDRLHFLMTTLPAGRHQVRLRFHDRRSRSLSGLDQVWYYTLDVERMDRILLLRSRECPGREGLAVVNPAQSS